MRHLRIKDNEKVAFKDENKYFDEGSILNKAIEFNSQNRIQDAVLAWEAALTKDEKNKEAWKLLGSLKQEADQDNIAIICFKKAIEIDGKDSEAFVKLAVSYKNENIN